MEYSSFDISKKFLKIANEENRSIDPMKLIKLVYIAHGWHLGLTGEPLIADEVQAWEYGPVIPKLYQVTKRFHTSPVDPALIDLYSDKEIDADTSKFLSLIWKSYGKMSAIELSARTHEKGTAWSNVYNGAHNIIMTNDDIKAHYLDLIKNSQERTSQQTSEKVD